MGLTALPPVACWRHQGLRSGFEVSFFAPLPSGLRISGTTTGFQEADAWIVNYDIVLDDLWRTRRARVRTRNASGSFERHVESDGEGHWRIDGEAVRHLDGCFDIDLEASAMTNALPVHRLDPDRGEMVVAPAAYVRVTSGGVERLEQFYTRSADHGRLTFAYEAPAFDFHCWLVYDASGLVLDYPGIAVREG